MPTNLTYKKQWRYNITRREQAKQDFFFLFSLVVLAPNSIMSQKSTPAFGPQPTGIGVNFMHVVKA